MVVVVALLHWLALLSVSVVDTIRPLVYGSGKLWLEFCPLRGTDLGVCVQRGGFASMEE